jgi:hypothetical protein
MHNRVPINKGLTVMGALGLRPSHGSFGAVAWRD